MERADPISAGLDRLSGGPHRYPVRVNRRATSKGRRAPAPRRLSRPGLGHGRLLLDLRTLTDDEAGHAAAAVIAALARSNL